MHAPANSGAQMGPAVYPIASLHATETADMQVMCSARNTISIARQSMWLLCLCTQGNDVESLAELYPSVCLWGLAARRTIPLKGTAVLS